LAPGFGSPCRRGQLVCLRRPVPTAASDCQTVCWTPHSCSCSTSRTSAGGAVPLPPSIVLANATLAVAPDELSEVLTLVQQWQYIQAGYGSQMGSDTVAWVRRAIQDVQVGRPGVGARGQRAAGAKATAGLLRPVQAASGMGATQGAARPPHGLLVWCRAGQVSQEPWTYGGCAGRPESCRPVWRAHAFDQRMHKRHARALIARLGTC
jgi:hypothetical protein